jgi:hypothetical protein
LNDVSQEILQLRPVQFHYKADPDGPVEYGLIAEEVAEVFPQLVLYGPEGEAESVRYDALVPLLVNELTRVQQSLEKAISDLTAVSQRLAALEARDRSSQRAGQ